MTHSGVTDTSLGGDGDLRHVRFDSYLSGFTGPDSLPDPRKRFDS
jgi:hypothetical protein